MVVVADLIAPRVQWVPEAADDELGDRAVEFCRRVGLKLDPEQELVLRGSLGVNAGGRWQTPEVGFTAPRQNGKGEVLLGRELFGLYELDERFIVHSAHEFKTSERHSQRLEAVVRGCPELFKRVKRAGSGRLLGFRYSHGDEALELDDGSKIEFRTRTKSGMRGFDDVALLVLDEAMILSEWAHGAMMPTVRASKAERGPQLWYTGSAVDQDVHEHGIVLARVRERGLAGEDQRLAYFEWSLDFDHPDDVPDEVIEDRERWAEVNFAIGRGRVQIEQMELEHSSLSRRAFLTELLGVGDWPATDGSSELVISLEAWREVEDEASVLVDPVCLAWDVSPSRRTSVAAAGLNEAGEMHVEVIHARAGTGWLPDRLAELLERHEVLEVATDGLGPSAAQISRVEEIAGVEVKRTTAGEYAEACGLFADGVGEKTLRHIGQEELDVAVKGARTRPLVDRWAWSRTKSVADVGPLVASSIAVWSATRQDIGEVVIY